MKNIVVLIFCLVTTEVFSQNKPAPTFFLNSDKIDWENVHIKPSSIDSMRVEHKTEGGEVYIKTSRSLTFLTLEMILKLHTDIEDSVGQVIYIIDGKVVTDKSKVKVDDSFFIEVKITRFDKLNYIDERHSDLILAEVQLLNEKPKPTIWIRGDEMAETKN
jgi:hypothetical protein